MNIVIISSITITITIIIMKGSPHASRSQASDFLAVQLCCHGCTVW